MIDSAADGNFFSISSSFSDPAASPIQDKPFAASVCHRRRMTREAGRAVEMLGHAIEYLADEFALESMSAKRAPSSGTRPELEAIKLLMARNREIYLSCPAVPTLGEWLRSRLGLLRA